MSILLFLQERMFDFSENPCLWPSAMYGAGAGVAAGATYNIATARSPFMIGFAAYLAVTVGSV